MSPSSPCATCCKAHTALGDHGVAGVSRRKGLVNVAARKQSQVPLKKKPTAAAAGFLGFKTAQPIPRYSPQGYPRRGLDFAIVFTSDFTSRRSPPIDIASAAKAHACTQFLGSIHKNKNVMPHANARLQLTTAARDVRLMRVQVRGATWRHGVDRFRRIRRGGRRCVCALP